MKALQDINYQITLEKFERELNFLHGEYQELLTYEVRLKEDYSEYMLNQILNDAERRIEAARRGLSDASKLKDPAERKQHVGRMLGHLNRTRTLLDRVVKEFFPEKVDDKGDGQGTPAANRDEFLSPQQAAQTLGIHPSRLQSLVSSNKLRMYNDNGRWALKGSEVQKLADQMK